MRITRMGMVITITTTVMAIIMDTATAIITPMAMPTVGTRATTTLIIIAISTCGPPTCT